MQAPTPAIDPPVHVVRLRLQATPCEPHHAFEPAAFRVSELWIDPAAHALAPIASALALATTTQVWITPDVADLCTREVFDMLHAQAGFKGVVASDGVRDFGLLCILPRARAAEAAALVVHGGLAARFLAGVPRVRLPEAVIAHVAAFENQRVSAKRAPIR